MSELLIREIGKKTVETLEKAEKLGRTMDLTDEKLRGRDACRPMSSMLENHLSEQAELDQAALKFKQARGWIERREINPNYFWSKDYRINCGSCAFALWRRLSGADPDAVATRTNVAKEIEDMELITGLKLENTSPEAIEEILKARGPGSHLIVGISRFGDRPGHWFNAYYDGKQVWTLDGQKGKVWEWPHNYGNIRTWEVLL